MWAGLYAPGAGVRGVSSRKRAVVEAKAEEPEERTPRDLLVPSRS